MTADRAACADRSTGQPVARRRPDAGGELGDRPPDRAGRPVSGLTVALITAALIVLSAFFVMIEFALLGARRHRLETRASQRRSVRAALRGMNELTVMLAGAQLGITACTFALGAVTKPAVDRWLGPVFERGAARCGSQAPRPSPCRCCSSPSCIW